MRVQQVWTRAAVRIVARYTLTFHIRHLVDSSLFVAGVADLFFRQNQRDRSSPIRNVHHMTDVARVSEVEVNGLPFGLLPMAGQAFAAVGNLRVVHRDGGNRREHDQE